MIPKIIHYAWFGNKPKPKHVRRCIKNWKEKLPGFEIIEWNEKNFSLEENKFAQEAYEQGEWAFVSDYVRIAVLEKYGGIYLDTDVIMLKEFKNELKYDFFSGFESEGLPFSSAVVGSVKHQKILERILDFYEGASFEKNNIANLINTRLISQILIDEYGCDPNDKEQDLADHAHIYPSDILCNPSGKSVAIHVRDGSWVSNADMMGKVGVGLRWHIRSSRQAQLYEKIKKIQMKLKKVF